MAWHSQTWTWFDGAWHEGNPGFIGPRTHAAWLGSSVFDGARVFESVMPDMDRHAARVNRSAESMGLKATMAPEAIVGLTRDGAKKFAPGTALYVKPMYWAEADGASTILFDPDSTRFALCLFEAPMPTPNGFSVMKSSFRRPTLESMPTDTKAGCLYPNNARAIREARAKGFDNALVCDMLGNVAETATSNIFLAKDGVVRTPAAERHLPQRHHPPAGDRSPARFRRGGRGGDAALRGLRAGGRDFLERQLLQGRAGDPHRRTRPAARADVPQGARALLGLRPRPGGPSRLRRVAHLGSPPSSSS